MKPLKNRIVVKPLPVQEKTAGGIYIPDTAKERPVKGTVLAVGTGSKDETMDIKIGDIVLYGKYSGIEYDDNLIMSQSDVLAIIN